MQSVMIGLIYGLSQEEYWHLHVEPISDAPKLRGNATASKHQLLGYYCSDVLNERISRNPTATPRTARTPKAKMKRALWGILGAHQEP